MAKLVTAAKSGDYDSAMRALRNELWDSIFATDSGKDIAALVKRWLEVCNELGDKRRKPLEEIRDKLASAIEASNSGRDVASLSIRLLEVLRELDALPDANAKPNAAQRAREMVRNRGATQRKPETDV